MSRARRVADGGGPATRESDAVASDRDWLDDDEIRRIVEITFVRRVDTFAELPSTNTHALERISASQVEPPHLFLARQQTAGRGRGQNQWWAGPGALTFSLVLDAGQRGLAVHRWPLVALTTGLAICETVAQLFPGCDLGLKWPNDVFLGGRKLAGILVEVPRAPPGLVVLGIGLNVNNSLAHAPHPLPSVATSLLDAAGYALRLSAVLVALLRHLEQQLDLLAADHASLAQRWQSLCLLTGREVEVAVGAEVVRGRCLGIQPDGALEVEMDGEVRRCLAGVVRWFGE